MGQKQRLRAERRKLDGQNLSVKFSVTDDDDPEGVEVALDGAALTPPGPADDGIAVDLTPAPAPSPALGMVDDDDGDDGDDTDAAAFAELKRQYEEAKSAREAAELRAKDREAAEARYRTEAEHARGEREATDARLRAEQERRDELEAYRIKAEREQLVSHKAVLEGALDRAETQRMAAENAFTEAMEAGDFRRAGQAQSAISDSVLEKRRYAEGLDRLNEQIAAPVPEYTRAPEPERTVQQQPAQVDQFEAAIAQLGEADKAWLRVHKADIANPRREQLLRSFAIQAETSAADGGYGLTPGTAEYHAFLDEAMGYSQPADPAGGDPDPAPQAASPAPRQPAKRPTAAPASRATASNQTTKVFLTDWDRDQAKQLKMSERDYASFKLKSTEGQLSQAQAGGRLMARYSAD